VIAPAAAAAGAGSKKGEREGRKKESRQEKETIHLILLPWNGRPIRRFNSSSFMKEASKDDTSMNHAEKAKARFLLYSNKLRQRGRGRRSPRRSFLSRGAGFSTLSPQPKILIRCFPAQAAGTLNSENTVDRPQIAQITQIG
jgi:hypothetical protein